MHIILGGAYNGKRKYAQQLIAKLQPKELVVCEGILPDISKASANKRFIVSEFEQIIKPLLHLPEDEVAEQVVQQLLLINQLSEIYCICTDISRGIVPLEKEARQTRDTCGRIYQQLCEQANIVTRVWYGIPQRLKGEAEDGEK